MAPIRLIESNVGHLLEFLHEVEMTNPTSIQQCKVRLPVVVWAPGQAKAIGITKYVSLHAIRFTLDDPVAVRTGAPLVLFVCLPKEMTAGNQALIRVRARVTRIERSNAGTERLTCTAKMESYDFIAKSLGI